MRKDKDSWVDSLFFRKILTYKLENLCYKQRANALFRANEVKARSNGNKHNREGGLD